MRCPKCGYISFDNVEKCLKCKKNIADASSLFQGSVLKVTTPVFLKLVPDEEELEEVERLKEENERLQTELQMKFNPSDMIGNGQAMQVVFNLISKVAPTAANVLITGESGVGKELVAKSIHFNSQHASQKFEEINCSGVAKTLLEVELFGQEAKDEDAKADAAVKQALGLD